MRFGLRARRASTHMNTIIQVIPNPQNPLGYIPEHVTHPLRARITQTLTCGSGSVQSSLELDISSDLACRYANSVVVEGRDYLPFGWIFLVGQGELSKLPQPPAMERGFPASALAASAAGTGSASRTVHGEWTEIEFHFPPNK